MKHIRRIVLLLLPLLLVAGCGGKRASVQKIKEMVAVEIEKADKQLGGKYIDNVTLLRSVSFDGQNVTYDNLFDEERARMTIREFMDSPQKDALEINLQVNWATNPSLEPVKVMIRRLGGMIRYDYTGSRTGDGFSITIDPKD